MLRKKKALCARFPTHIVLQNGLILLSAEVGAAAVGRDHADIGRAAREVQRRAVLERVSKAAVDIAACPLDRHILAAGHKVAGAAADEVDGQAAVAVHRFHIGREDEQIGKRDRFAGRAVLIVGLVLHGRVLAAVSVVGEGRALGRVKRHLHVLGRAAGALVDSIVGKVQAGLVAALMLGAELVPIHERFHVRAVEEQRVLRAVLAAAGVAVEHGAGVAVAHAVQMVGVIGLDVAVGLLAAAGVDDNGVIRQGDAQIIRAQAADAADGLHIVQVAENGHHARDAALGRDLVDHVCVADADLRLRVDDVVDHDGKRPGVCGFAAQRFTGQRGVVALVFRVGTVDGRLLGFFTAAGAGTGEQRHGEKTSKNAIETFQNAIPSCYNNLVNVHDTRLAEDCQMPRTVLQWK